MTATGGTVVLLNASYEPLGRVSFQHAVRMLFREVAVVEEGHQDRTTGSHRWPHPRHRRFPYAPGELKVIKLVRYVAAKWLHRPAGWTRDGVLRRDRHRCAYCGGHAATIDHVLPTSRGGDCSWLNTVAACGPCNSRKANRTPAEAGMRLGFTPYVPTRAQLVAP